MIRGSELRAPDSHFLSQGDIVEGCFVRQPAAALWFLEKVGKPGTGKPDFRTVTEPPSPSRCFILAEGQQADVIVLSYDCDIDKALARIASGEPASPNETCFVAPLFSVHNYHRIEADIRADRVENLVLIEAGALRTTETVLDFGLTQSISMREFLRSVARGHKAALSCDARTELLRRFARFFGSQDRINAALAGRDDETLLDRSLAALGLR